MIASILTYIICTIYLVLWIGHFFCQPFAKPLKNQIEQGVFWPLVLFTLVSISNVLIITFGEPSFPMFWIAIGINAYGVVAMLVPFFYEKLKSFRDNLKEKKEY